MLSSKSTYQAAGPIAAKRTAAVGALLMLCLALGAPGCIWLDDFGKFKIDDAGTAPDSSDAQTARDAQTGRPETDAGPSAERCKDVDCSDLDDECVKGVCDPATGECTAEKSDDGTACFDGSPCTFGDSCKDGACVGTPLDCSALDDECSQGMCDPETGGCTFGPNQVSQSCDDANDCTVNDRCTDDPENRCLGDVAPAGTSCDDFNSCTGTDAEPDQCGDQARCLSGAPVAVGTSCDDDSECTEADKCNADGRCDGDPIREGQPCQTDCTGNTTCRAGECVADEGEALAYNSQCLFSFCGISDICLPKWEDDPICHCGCGYEDPACSPCSAYMCQRSAGHEAARWCDNSGAAAGNCPESLKDDGKCDCGCQFDDPDCNGGACCEGTGEPGCNDSYVEDCVCNRTPNGDPTCCDAEWTDRCAQLAVNLGCMLCP